MSSHVMMIDVDKFAALVDAKAAEYHVLSKAQNGKDNFMAVYNGAIGKAMVEIGQCIIKSSTIEKWD